MPSFSKLVAPMNRRDFLKSLGGMAASAALPNIPGMPDAPSPAPAALGGIRQPQFITDQKVLSGFENGLTTFGGEGANFFLDDNSFNPIWETIGEDHVETKWVKEAIGDMQLGEATARIPGPVQDGAGPWAWNSYTKQWHPTSILRPGPNHVQHRYLRPGSAIPEGSVGYFDGMDGGDYQEWRASTEFYKDPQEMGQRLLDEHYRGKFGSAARKGPDKAEMQDPEYRKRYLDYAAHRGLAPGGRPETPKALMDSGLPTGNVAIPGADDAGSLPSMIGRLRRAQKPAATGIMSLAPLLLAPQGEEQ